MSEWRSDAKPPHPPVEMPPCENCGYPREQHDPRDMSCHGGVMRYAPKIASLDRTWSGDSTTSRSRFDHSCRSHTMPKPAEPSAEVLAIVQAHHAAEPDCGVGDDLAARIKAYADQRVREDRKKAAGLFRTMAPALDSSGAAALQMAADDLERGEHDKQAG